jgi:hypothetical protein
MATCQLSQSSRPIRREPLIGNLTQYTPVPEYNAVWQRADEIHLRNYKTVPSNIVAPDVLQRQKRVSWDMLFVKHSKMRPSVRFDKTGMCRSRTLEIWKMHYHRTLANSSLLTEGHCIFFCSSTLPRARKACRKQTQTFLSPCLPKHFITAMVRRWNGFLCPVERPVVVRE